MTGAIKRLMFGRHLARAAGARAWIWELAVEKALAGRHVGHYPDSKFDSRSAWERYMHEPGSRSSWRPCQGCDRSLPHDCRTDGRVNNW